MGVKPLLLVNDLRMPFLGLRHPACQRCIAREKLGAFVKHQFSAYLAEVGVALNRKAHRQPATQLALL